MTESTNQTSLSRPGGVFCSISMRSGVTKYRPNDANLDVVSSGDGFSINRVTYRTPRSFLHSMMPNWDFLDGSTFCAAKTGQPVCAKVLSRPLLTFSPK